MNGANSAKSTEPEPQSRVLSKAEFNNPAYWLVIAPMLFMVVVGSGIGEAQWGETGRWLAMGIGGGIGAFIGFVCWAMYRHVRFPSAAAAVSALSLVVFGVAGVLGEILIGGHWGGYIGAAVVSVVVVLSVAFIACPGDQERTRGGKSDA